MGILYILLGAAFGAIITYLRLNNNPIADKEELDKLQQKDYSLDLRIKSREEQHQQFEEELKSTKEALDQRESEFLQLGAEINWIKAQLESTPNRNPNDLISPTETNIEVEKLKKQVEALSTEKSELEIEKESLKEKNLQIASGVANLEKELKEKTAKCHELHNSLLQEKEAHQDSKKKLIDQSNSIRSLGKKFNSDFQNIGIKILNELESKQKAKS